MNCLVFSPSDREPIARVLRFLRLGAAALYIVLPHYIQRIYNIIQIYRLSNIFFKKIKPQHRSVGAAVLYYLNK